MEWEGKDIYVAFYTLLYCPRFFHWTFIIFEILEDQEIQLFIILIKYNFLNENFHQEFARSSK